jgi:thioester reductase-like protein
MTIDTISKMAASCLETYISEPNTPAVRDKMKESIAELITTLMIDKALQLPNETSKIVSIIDIIIHNVKQKQFIYKYLKSTDPNLLSTIDKTISLYQ